MNMIFLGPPGAGKGSVAQKIVKELEIIQISTGDLLRGAIAAETELGIEAKRYMDKGDLVPDDLVIGLLKERIAMADCKPGFILDGFPRTIPQAEALDKAKVKIDHVVNFAVPDELVIHRITGRRTSNSTGKIYNIHPDCEPNPPVGYPEEDLLLREDDILESVKNRLEVYKEQTEPLIAFYKKKELLVDINANQPLDDIVVDTKKAIN